MKRTLIIAEAGVNHNGDVEIAKKLIDAASDAGVDYVKFQTFKTENLVSKQAKKAAYQLENTADKTESQFEMIKKLELDLDTHVILKAYCSQKGIRFLSTAFDMDSIDILIDLDIELFKIPSGEITNWPYLNKIGGLHKPIILSTGMANMEEVGEALNVLLEAGATKKAITILHCNTQYPTPMSDVNLSAMQTIADKYQVKTGYSDHTLGIEIPIAAVALGATCIEKHFTLNRNMEGPDHRASLEPEELKAMVTAIRNIEDAMGDGSKVPSASEKPNIPFSRKSMVAAQPIQKGEIFSPDNLSIKRPGTGISPMQWNQLLGSKSKKDYSTDDLIDQSELSN